jgi:parvulin-like peptidyl-prolyl isomerase
MSRARLRSWWPVAVLVVLLLAGCGAGEDGAQPVPPGDQPTVVVVTQAPAQELPAPAPTLVPTVTPTPTPPAPLAAQVNDQYIFMAEYERRVAQYERALLEQGIDLNTDEGQAYLAEARRDVLEGLIDSALIEQGAMSMGISLSDEELESQVEADIAAGGGQAAFDEWLQATGQAREDYKEMLRQSLLAQRVLDTVTADVGSEAEQVHARHIMVGSEEEAQQILTMLQEGADFVALARDRSLDLATKDNGGDLGWFPRGLVALELENAAFALQPGQVSGMVHLGEGYHVIQVVERESARPLAPEMQLDLQLAAFEGWLAELRASAVIERFVEE